jgi:hypothetical protein
MGAAVYDSGAASPPSGQPQKLRLDASGNLKMSGSVSPVPVSSGATTSTSVLPSAAASTNATSVKASAGTLMHIIGYNAAAATRYVKIYDKASAPTVGTDTPVLTFAVPATTAFSLDFPFGVRLATGIAYAMTTGAPHADTGALTAGDILGLNVIYA